MLIKRTKAIWQIYCSKHKEAWRVASSLLVFLSHFPPFHPSRIPTALPSTSVTMYNPVPIFLTDPAWRSRIFPTVPMLSVTGRPRGFSWCGGSPWEWQRGQGRRSVWQFRLLSSIKTPFILDKLHLVFGKAANLSKAAAGRFCSALRMMFFNKIRWKRSECGHCAQLRPDFIWWNWKKWQTEKTLKNTLDISWDACIITYCSANGACTL